MANPAVGSVGFRFRVATSYDMSNYQTLELVFTKPDGTQLTVSAILGTTGIQGYASANQWVYYETVANDLSVSGDWTVRVRYVDASKTLFSEQQAFTVDA